MLALWKLGLCVVAYCASEVDREAKRVVRLRWPGVIELWLR